MFSPLNGGPSFCGLPQLSLNGDKSKLILGSPNPEIVLLVCIFVSFSI